MMRKNCNISARLGAGEASRTVGGRALDSGQRRPQFVTHQAKKLGSRPLQFLQRRHVLQGDHYRLDHAILGMDRRGVDQRGDAPAAGDLEHHLLGAHRRGAAQHLRQGKLFQRDLPSVGPPALHHPQQLLRRVSCQAQALDNSPRLPIDQHRLAGPCIENRHAHRRGVDQGLQVGPGPVLVTVGARVGDGRRGLRGEQHQNFLVLAGEFPSA